ncbi:MAG: hypothetical protein K2Y56_04260 [Methylobacterium sp.]|uniref:hypothetical protein n=1 Tax=Methylobacterium sp. TaxID=409 RepID=UPI0025DF2BE1|nr:hypothetical protein [Methylobacterium sp.]MBX9930740.1 hypothetical protein [Methylobacterium sp.]
MQRNFLSREEKFFPFSLRAEGRHIAAAVKAARAGSLRVHRRSMTRVTADPAIAANTGRIHPEIDRVAPPERGRAAEL